MHWRHLLLTLALIATLVQPAIAQDDSDSSQQPADTTVETPLQPAPTPTAAPSLPASTFGPAAPGTVLYSDSFDDPAAGRLPKTSPDPSHFERGYAEGEYVL